MTKKIRILFIDHTPFAGGPQISLAKDLEYLDRSRFQPFLLTGNETKFDFIYKNSNTKIFRLDFGRLKKIHPAALPELFGSLRAFLTILNEIKPEIVVTNTINGLILAGLSRAIRQRKNDFKLICRIWDYTYPKWLLNIPGFNIAKFLLVSRSTRDFYRLPKHKTEVVYLGSDVHLKRKAGRGKGKVLRLKKELGIEEGDFVIGFAGRLVEWKGPLYLLDSFRRINLPKRGSKLKLVFFGTGKNQDDDVEKVLRKEIKRQKLEGRVALAGFVEDQALIYKTIDCFVQTSIEREPFAINMIESALSKVPIIATHIGGTPEFIKSGKNGLLVKPKDTNQLAQALLRLYKDDQGPASGRKRLAKRLAGNAYKDAQKFREEKFIKRLEEIFNQVVK